MNNDKEIQYVIKWVQSYPELQELIDKEVNLMLELSGYKEANEVIDLIKSKL